MELSIVIVSWNVRELLKKCLQSIERETKNLSYEVFVVDNGSMDGSAEMIKKEFPNAYLIENKNNIGFAKANNQAIEKARGEFILLLNPDTEILDHALDTTVQFMRHHPECGIVGCKLLNSDGTLQQSVRRFPTLAAITLLFLKVHRLLPSLPVFGKYFAKDFDYNKTQEAEQLMGSLMMIRKKVIDQIGSLDEKFYIWFEEVDFCKRARNAGWKIYYTPNAQVVHHQAKSFVQRSAIQKQIWFNNSALRYFEKHHAFIEYLGLLLIYPFSITLAIFVQLLASRR